VYTDILGEASFHSPACGVEHLWRAYKKLKKLGAGEKKSAGSFKELKALLV